MKIVPVINKIDCLRRPSKKVRQESRISSALPADDAV